MILENQGDFLFDDSNINCIFADELPRIYSTLLPTPSDSTKKLIGFIAGRPASNYSISANMLQAV